MTTIRKLLVAAATITALAVVAVPATAHVVYEEADTWIESPGAIEGQCVWQKAEVSHGSQGNGYFLAETWSKANQPYPGWVDNCGAKYVVNPRQIKTQLQFYRTRSNGTQARLCYSSGATFNVRDAHEHRVRYGTTTQTVCGAAYYRTRALGQVWQDQQQAWKGGYFWSGARGTHKLPA